MRISEQLKASMKKQIERMFYDDVCSISRQIPVVDEYGSDDYAFIVVHENIPCHISKKRNNTVNITMQDATINSEIRLHVSTDIDVQLNDVVKVWRNGALYGVYNAGKTHHYDTFNQVELVVKERANNVENG